ncbi:hypothetical protein PYCCODRAFT_1428258 [Trametes coccinea BRFM310]|uniref:Uncharacterized protein n=1 Tax=Trametes coccinea (strain BRFM310) TaxID=1353009 RepID=A0A1Y2IBL0_TRAC3|nr:hypothetical protein PYCCODRAFT_1428258 [Trametes coccinea BRFM310]
MTASDRLRANLTLSSGSADGAESFSRFALLGEFGEVPGGYSTMHGTLPFNSSGHHDWGPYPPDLTSDLSPDARPTAMSLRAGDVGRYDQSVTSFSLGEWFGHTPAMSLAPFDTSSWPDPSSLETNSSSTLLWPPHPTLAVVTERYACGTSDVLGPAYPSELPKGVCPGDPRHSPPYPAELSDINFCSVGMQRVVYPYSYSHPSSGTVPSPADSHSGVADFDCIAARPSFALQPQPPGWSYQLSSLYPSLPLDVMGSESTSSESSMTHPQPSETLAFSAFRHHPLGASNTDTLQHGTPQVRELPLVRFPARMGAQDLSKSITVLCLNALKYIDIVCLIYRSTLMANSIILSIGPGTALTVTDVSRANVTSTDTSESVIQMCRNRTIPLAAFSSDGGVTATRALCPSWTTRLTERIGSKGDALPHYQTGTIAPSQN